MSAGLGGQQTRIETLLVTISLEKYEWKNHAMIFDEEISVVSAQLECSCLQFVLESKSRRGGSWVIAICRSVFVILNGPDS